MVVDEVVAVFFLIIFSGLLVGNFVEALLLVKLGQLFFDDGFDVQLVELGLDCAGHRLFDGAKHDVPESV